MARAIERCVGARFQRRLRGVETARRQGSGPGLSRSSAVSRSASSALEETWLIGTALHVTFARLKQNCLAPGRAGGDLLVGLRGQNLLVGDLRSSMAFVASNSMSGFLLLDSARLFAAFSELRALAISDAATPRVAIVPFPTPWSALVPASRCARGGGARAQYGGYCDAQHDALVKFHVRDLMRYDWE